MCLLLWQFNKESIECEIEHSYSLAQRAEAGLAIPRSLSLSPSLTAAHPQTILQPPRKAAAGFNNSPAT